MPKQVQYAHSGELCIAYQVFGEGSIDLVIVPGFITNLDAAWDVPAFGPMFLRLGQVARCVVFDKRGTGLSDRDLGFGSLEERMDDIRAVMDDAGIERAALFGYSEGGPLSLAFAATYPQRVSALVLYGSFARLSQGPDYAEGIPTAISDAFIESLQDAWGSGRALHPFIRHIPETAATLQLLARYERGACSPKMAAHIMRANFDVDVRSLLPTVSPPTLVLHSAGDRAIPVAFGRHLGEHIPDARYIEGKADHHMTWHGGQAWFLDEIEAFLTGHRPAQAVERFLSTVLFTDIVGSTEMAAQSGDQVWRRMLDRHDALAAEQVARFGGRVIKTTGDGLLAIVDSPSRGVACASAIREAVDPLGLQIRAGVHTGEIERRGDDVGGIAVHIGARIAALAEPGNVWVSRTVRDLTVGSALNFVARGLHSLKGVPDKWELYALEA